MLPLLLLRQRVAMILKMYRQAVSFPLSPSSSYGLRSPREKSAARDLPARIRVVDAPFLLAISAPSLELGNPHGSRCGYAQANAGQDTSTPSGVLSLRPTVLRISGARSQQYPTTFRRLIDHRNHLNFDQLFGLS
jgi:hypothetical protein